MSEAVLIEELIHNASASGNRLLERRMADTAVWFYKNKDHIPLDNLASRQAFLQKAFWTLLEINALLLDRVHELESRAKGPTSLWLPRGMKVDDHEFV